MPVLETVVAKAAGSVATSMTRLALERAGERAFGSSEQRAFETVCRKTLKNVAEDLLQDEQIGKDEAIHLLELLDIVVTARGPGGVDWVDGSDDSRLADWMESAHAHGVDPSTLPALAQLIERIRAAIPSFLWEEGKRDESALFNRVTLETLDELMKVSRSLQDEVASLVAGNRVPIAPFVEKALDAALAQCRSKNVRFFTPHVLVALLDIEGGRVQACLDSVDGDVARVMVDKLRSYVGRYDARRAPFRAFSWAQRDDIRRAQQIAAGYDLHAVDDLCLFVAVLEGRSQTVAALEKRLGATRFHALRAIAKRSLGAQEYGHTDGEVFGTES